MGPSCSNGVATGSLHDKSHRCIVASRKSDTKMSPIYTADVTVSRVHVARERAATSRALGAILPQDELLSAASAFIVLFNTHTTSTARSDKEESRGWR